MALTGIKSVSAIYVDRSHALRNLVVGSAHLGVNVSQILAELAFMVGFQDKFSSTKERSEVFDSLIVFIYVANKFLAIVAV